MPTVTRIAVDLAKNVFEIACANQAGKVIKRARLQRHAFLPFFVHYPNVEVVMEACGSAHHWGRELHARGHSVRLLPVQYVKPYRPKHRKTDRVDTGAILKAADDERVHDVPVKSVEDQALQALQRTRSGWVKERTARINQLRGLLREFGLIAPLGADSFVKQALSLIDDNASDLPPMLITSLQALHDDILRLDLQIRNAERQLSQAARSLPVVQQLLSIPGIGLITACALVAAIPNIHVFKNGRHLAAWLGLVPSEHSSGNTRRLGAISKVGCPHLRSLITHGARSVLLAAKRPGAAERDRLKRWALDVEARRGHNKATLAVANKLARIAFAVWNDHSRYLPQPLGASNHA